MKTIKGDIFNCKEDIIVHQTNCQGVMGHGIAAQVKAKYPEVFQGYYHFCKTNLPSEILGETLICQANDGKYIANVFGQLHYGEGLQTDYERLEKALLQVRDFAIENELSVAVPYKIGCGLAHGDWNIVNKIIRKVFKKVEANIYKFEKHESY